MNEFTIQDINQTIHKIDLISRPYIFYCNPTDKEYLVEAVGDTLIECMCWIKPGTVFVADRAKIEEWYSCYVDYRDIGLEDTNESFSRKYR